MAGIAAESSVKKKKKKRKKVLYGRNCSLTLGPPKVRYIPHTSLFLEKVGKIRDFVDTALEAYKPLP